MPSAGWEKEFAAIVVIALTRSAIKATHLLTLLFWSYSLMKGFVSKFVSYVDTITWNAKKHKTTWIMIEFWSRQLVFPVQSVARLTLLSNCVVRNERLSQLGFWASRTSLAGWDWGGGVPIPSACFTNRILLLLRSLARLASGTDFLYCLEPLRRLRKF